ncbi:Delphilin [Aphelenchoides fujianensis]|nr:Delphilin [Aphelenchoides fujianensis]
MLEDLFDRAWSCFNRMAPDKKPPDKTHEDPVGETLKRRSSVAGVAALDVGALPDGQQLDREFKQLLEELDLSPQKEQELKAQSAEKKWLMIVEQHVRQDKTNSPVNVEAVVRRLQDWAAYFPDKYTLPLAVQQIEALGVALRTESLSFVQHFIDLDGITLLTRILAETRNGADCLALPILTCFKALLNSATARQFVLDRSDTLLSVVSTLDTRNPRCQVGTRKKVLFNPQISSVACLNALEKLLALFSLF